MGADARRVGTADWDKLVAGLETEVERANRRVTRRTKATKRKASAEATAAWKARCQLAFATGYCGIEGANVAGIADGSTDRSKRQRADRSGA